MLFPFVSIQFQFYFTPLPGFFSPFPRGTRSLSVTRSYLALGDGPPFFTQNSSWFVLLWIPSASTKFKLRDFYPLSSCFPAMFIYLVFRFAKVLNPTKITPRGLGSYPFAHHYLGNRCFTFFSSSYLDVSVHWVPLCILCIHMQITVHYHSCVPTFGYPRIKACWRLPVAFRSLPRPSSASSAKASPICSL